MAYGKKIQLIFLPFLCIALLFIAGYTLLNWLLIIKLELFSVKELYLHLGLPFLLPWIPVLLWLRPRILLLNISGGKGDRPMLYMVVAAMTMTLSTMIAQDYLQLATGEMTNLQSVEDLNKVDETKYYTLSQFHIDKQSIGVETGSEISGRYNEDFTIRIYIAAPIYRTDWDIKKPAKAWYGITYSKRISNRVSSSQKEIEFQNFYRTSLARFENQEPVTFTYLDRISHSDKLTNLTKAAKKSKKYSGRKPTILQPVKTDFEARLGNKFEWIFGRFTIFGSIFLIMILIPKLDEKELKSWKKNKPTVYAQLAAFLNFIKPGEVLFITPILIYINVLIFLIMVFAGLGFISFSGPDLIQWGANYKPLVESGEYWRLLTSVFLHAGVMHVGYNMFTLLIIGFFLEEALGRSKFVIIYILSGIFASYASLYWNENSVGVGASGAIFGMAGLFLAAQLFNILKPDFNRGLLAATIAYIGINLLIGLSGGVDNAAHIGGLLFGFITGLFMRILGRVKL